MAALTSLVDDLDYLTVDEDGKPKTTHGAQTYRVALGDRVIEIDLADANAKKLVDALEPYLAAGRAVEAGKPARATKGKRKQAPRTGGRSDYIQVRQWCAVNGIVVAAKGSISPKILAQYDEAQKTALAA